MTISMWIRPRNRLQGMVQPMKGVTTTKEWDRSPISPPCTPNFKWWIDSRLREVSQLLPRDLQKWAILKIISPLDKTTEEDATRVLWAMATVRRTIRQTKPNRRAPWTSSRPPCRFSMCKTTTRISHLWLSSPMRQGVVMILSWAWDTTRQCSTISRHLCSRIRHCRQGATI